MEKPKVPPALAGTPAHKKRRTGGTPAKSSFFGAFSNMASTAMGGWPKTQSPTLSETTMATSPAKTMATSPAKTMASASKDVVGLSNEEIFE